ncbi:MAG: hypothetical protein PHS14_14245 [Elusimicrobia bacterium]|nr:hypothetical protein [Elusimicrobiota bacterium]
MARASVRQTNFASGELDPTLSGRTDLERYRNACLTMLNWLPLTQGGATRAPGTEFVALLWGATRLEAFEFSVDEWFVLAFRDGVVDIYKDDALHQSLTTPWTAADLWEFDYTQTLDTVIVTHEDHAPRRIYRGPSDVFAIEDLSDTANAVYLTNIPQDGGADVWSVARGWPRTVTFAENRLCFGGSKSYPSYRWFSKAAAYFDFDAGTGVADESITDVRLSNQFEAVQWVFGARRFVSGTTSQEWAVVQDGPLTPDSVDIKPQTSIGSARIAPVSIDGAVIHVARGGKQLQALGWTDVEQAYGTTPLALLAPRCVTGVRQLAAKRSGSPEEPHRVFAVNTDGVLGILSVLRDQEFQAWSRRTFQGEVESVAAVGGEVYLVVAYQYGPGVFAEGVFEAGVFEASGGSSSRFLVRWDPTLCVDFGLKKTAPLTTTWTGFDHLAGRTVQVTLDGSVHPDVVVAADGTITTEREGLILKAGVALPVPTLEPMSPVFDTQTGSVAMEKRRISKVTLQLSETSSLYVRGKPLVLRQAADIGSVEPFTGVITRTLLGYSRQPTVPLTAPEPLPATVLSLTTEVSF